MLSGGKMTKNWNFNILLCRKADENITGIENIFNKLETNDDDRASFMMVMLMNAIGCDEDRFAIHFFVEKLEKKRKRIAYLCSSFYQKTDESEDSFSCDVPGTTDVDGTAYDTTRFVFKNWYFPGAGDYIIKAYKYDNDDAVSIKGKSKKEILDYAKLDHLVSTYIFKVVKS